MLRKHWLLLCREESGGPKDDLEFQTCNDERDLRDQFCIPMS